MAIRALFSCMICSKVTYLGYLCLLECVFLVVVCLHMFGVLGKKSLLSFTVVVCAYTVKE